MAALSCNLLLRGAGVEVAIQIRPHPDEFTVALLRLDGADHVALARAGALYAVALCQVGDYGQCIGFGVPALPVMQVADAGPMAKVHQLELLAALASSYRALGQAHEARTCDQAWEALEQEVRWLHPMPPWVLALSTADSLWVVGKREEAVRALSVELEAHGKRRGRDASMAAPWIRLIACTRETYLALQTGNSADVVRATIAEAEASWHMKEATFDLAPEVLLGRAQTLLGTGSDPRALRELAYRALVFARDVRNKQALRWRALNTLVPSAESIAEAILLSKLAVEEVLSLQSDLTNVDQSLGGTEEGQLARLFAQLVSQLVNEGRLAEASLVVNLRWQKEILPTAYTAERGGLVPEATLLVGPERGAAMIYYAARNAREHHRAASLMSDLAAHIEAAVEAAGADPASFPSSLHSSVGLYAGEALLQVMPGASETSLILQSASGVSSLVMPISAREINERVFTALQKIERRASMAELPELAELFDQLITPIRSRMPGQRLTRLIVAATGALQSIPWACLHDKRQWLVESCSICRAPTESRQLLLATTQPPSLFIGGTGRGMAGVVGDIDVAAEMEGLRRVASDLGDVLFSPEERFSRQVLVDALRSRSIVSVSAHCFPDQLSPRQSRLMLGDGTTVLLDDLANVGSSSDLVVLSACGTGRMGSSLSPGGGGAIDRLLSASGVKAIVSTAWAVNNQSQTALMVAFFDALLNQRQDKDVALAGAQQRMIWRASKSSDMVDDWSLPYFWAAPMLTGNWRSFSLGDQY